LSTPTELAEWIRQASALAAEAPEPLREVAFRAAFDHLATAASPQVAESRTRRRRPSASRATPVRPRASSRVGPKTAVAELVEEGYFDSPRLVAEIRDHLASAKARRFERKNVATALLRLVRDGTVQRAREADGEYEYTRRA